MFWFRWKASSDPATLELDQACVALGVIAVADPRVPDAEEVHVRPSGRERPHSDAQPPGIRRDHRVGRRDREPTEQRDREGGLLHVGADPTRAARRLGETYAMEMTWSQACAMRLTRHGLAGPVAPERLAEQVETMCGAHAQVMSAAELSIGLRVAPATRADVRHALWVDRSLIKTYGPRGTVHLLAAADLPVWTGALSAALEGPRFPEGIRLTPDQQDRVVEAIDDALGERELTIDELGEEVVARTGPWAGERLMPAFQDLWPRWRQEIGTAANRGVLCFGPNRGPKVTYTSPRRWLSGFAPAPREEALAGVLRRYLYAYGPASPQQFGRWLGVSASWATRSSHFRRSTSSARTASRRRRERSKRPCTGKGCSSAPIRLRT